MYAQVRGSLLKYSPQQEELLKDVDVSDLESDPIVMFQKRWVIVYKIFRIVLSNFQLIMIYFKVLCPAVHFPQCTTLGKHTVSVLWRLFGHLHVCGFLVAQSGCYKLGEPGQLIPLYMEHPQGL